MYSLPRTDSTPLKLLLVAAAVLFAALLLLFPVPQTKAQDAPGGAQQQGGIFERRDNAAAIEEARSLYREQLIRYRREEQQRSVAETEYQQLETLAAYDRYVAATREAVSVRDDVLVTHLTLQRLSLEQTAGVQVDQKGEALDLAERLIAALNEHKRRNEAATDRTQVQASLDRFDELRPAVILLSAQMTTLEKLGELQDAIDRADELNSTLETTIQDASYLSNTERDASQRNLEIAQDTVTQAQNQLDAAREDIELDDLDRGDVNSVLDDTDPVYVSLRRVAGFQEELVAALQEAR